jgi:hypothetical protein
MYVIGVLPGVGSHRKFPSVSECEYQFVNAIPTGAVPEPPIRLTFSQILEGSQCSRAADDIAAGPISNTLWG